MYDLFSLDLTLNKEQRQDVVNALHANAHSGSWTECRGSIHTAFHEMTENASITVIPRVLAKIPALIFAGDQDLICNYVGLESMIKEMTWNGATGLGVCFLCFIPFSVHRGSFHTIDRENTILECECHARRHMGNLAKPYICKGDHAHNMSEHVPTLCLLDFQCIAHGTFRSSSRHARYDPPLYRFQLLLHL